MRELYDSFKVKKINYLLQEVILSALFTHSLRLEAIKSCKYPRHVWVCIYHVKSILKTPFSSIKQHGKCAKAGSCGPDVVFIHDLHLSSWGFLHHLHEQTNMGSGASEQLLMSPCWMTMLEDLGSDFRSLYHKKNQCPP